MINTILFDFDGTLLNTNDLIFKSYNIAFQTVLKRDVTDEEIHNLYGKPLYTSLEEYGQYQDEIYRVYREYNLENHDRLVKKFPYAAEGVKLFKQHGYKTAIVTSKRLPTLQKGINLMGLDGYFDVLITPDDTQKHKPDPMPIIVACEKLGVQPSNAIMVGDSIFDFECGKNAGTVLAGVNYSTTREKLLEYNPMYMADSILELAIKIIDNK